MRRIAMLAFAALAFLAATSFGAAAVAKRSPLEKRLAKALRVPHVSRAASAAVAVDLQTGAELFALNPDLPLAPASNEKLALTFALLKTFDRKMRIETRVEAAGTIEAGTLHGNLVLVGGGDPTLSSHDLRLLARRIRASGVQHVTGGVIGDESLFDGKRTCPGWKSFFYINESPPLSALVVDRARFRNYTARSPAKAAALLLRDALGTAGVRVEGGVAARRGPAEAVPIARTLSPPVASIVAFMDLHSDNFTAEEMLKLLALSASRRGTTAGGARVVMEMLKDAGVPMSGVRIVDGSGLSSSNRMTVGALVAILRAFAGDPQLETLLLRALPVAGVSGTLRDRMTTPPLRGHVVAKTGTTSIASSLSGYVNTRIAFAVIQNGNPLPYWWARVAQDRFTRVLATQ